jgi:micrococcal nuclease
MQNWLNKSSIINIFLLTFLFCHPSSAQVQEIVRQIIDGNTIILDTGKTIRYIGVGNLAIDTPEPFSKEAYEFNKSLVEGKKIKLEYDEQKTDNQGNILAYVYQDEVFVNAKIIESGYGSVFIVSPNIKYAEKFLTLEREARQAKRGIWSEVIINQTQSNPSQQNTVLSLENRISILEAEIKELKVKLEQISKIVETLQLSNDGKDIDKSVKDSQQGAILKSDNTQTNDKTIVYVSPKMGKKYHKQECKFLGKEPKSMTLEEAKRKYDPCKICFPEFSKENAKNK